MRSVPVTPITMTVVLLLVLTAQEVLAQNATINYLGWDSSRYRATLDGDMFVKTKIGSGETRREPFIRYLLWDGSRWAARLQGTTFVHAREGNFSSAAHTDTKMNFLAWDNVPSTASISANGFNVRAVQPTHLDNSPGTDPLDKIDLSGILDVTDAASHCNQKHSHASLPWSLQACNWEEQLKWCMDDAGYNEGAGEAARIALEHGLGLPPDLAILGGHALANAWKRRDMMRFAINLSKVRPWESTGIALACQWHNCHAFQCLTFHAPEVGAWLLNH